MVSVTAKTVTITNGTANDATVVDGENGKLFTNDATLATAVTTIETDNPAKKGAANIFTAANTFQSTVTLTSAADANAAGQISYYNSVFKAFQGSYAIPLLIPHGRIDGLGVYQAAGDQPNDLDIGSGWCWDDTGVDIIRMTTALTVKRTDASWAAGTNQGGWDTGSKASGDTVHVFVIKNPTAGAVDFLLSASATAPTLPSGYTLKRRIYSTFPMNGTSLRPFLSRGNLTKAIIQSDYLTTTLGNSRVSATLTVPRGIIVTPLGTVFFSGATLRRLMFTSLIQADTPLDSYDIGVLNSGDGMSMNLPPDLETNTSGQIGLRADQANSTVQIATRGYIDITRERLF